MQRKLRTFTGSTSSEVTPRETVNRALARRAAAEGFVLLKNEGGLLPIAPGTKLGLYGAGAVKTIKGGTGSGDVNERDCVTIWQGLANAGYELTSTDWLTSYDAIYRQARLDWKDAILKKCKEMEGNFFAAYSSIQFQIPAGAPLNVEEAQADGADTAIFVLSRIAGEGKDRVDCEGDYFISAEEKAILAQVSESYENIVLVVNTGGLVDLAFVDEFPKIRSIVQLMQAGQEGGNAFADMLSGAVTPSGKMTDTWALTYNDYPNASTFSHKSGDVDEEYYIEGIYVGYRYFDTFDVPVRYPFGYGLSYTTFSIAPGSVSVTGLGTAEPRVETTVAVTNTGSVYSGKEVVQIYVSCPQGKLPKEYRRLAAFAKTKLLAPGESQTLTVSFPLYQLASYSEEQSAWILEAGQYGVWAGNSLADAKVYGSLCLDVDAVLVQCEAICPVVSELTELSADPAKLAEKTAAWQAELAGCNAEPVAIRAADLVTKQISYTAGSAPLTGKAGEIVETLSEEQLILLATGDPGKGQGSALGSAGITVPGAAAETSSTASDEPWNVASMVLADGPAGLRLSQTYQVQDGKILQTEFLQAFEGGFFSEPTEPVGTTYYQFCTAIPVGTLLAQSWDPALVTEVGEMIGHEMNLFNVTLWLAPGMNIHRNPLCGRNFEYYSEDPLVAGLMAAAMTLGVQKVPGCGTTIKHFACNNQEDNRMGSDSIISERALREIYLKGFEIAVKDSQPMSIMTSYNMINGVHAANCYDTCTKAARDEWGFAGAIMTDWTTTNASPRGISTASGCMRAGNDMVMPGLPMDHDNLREELAAGTLTLDTLKRCIARTVSLSLQSNQYEDAVSYLDQFEGLDGWVKVQ